MKITKTLLAAAIALLPLTALAGGSIDVFYTDNELNIDGAPNGDADGNGYGFRGQAELGKGFSMIGLRQSSTVKPGVFAASDKLSETRIGVSYGHQLNKQFNLTGSLESVQFDAELFGKKTGLGATLNGYAANVGVSTNIIDKLNGNVSVGYVNLGKLLGETVSGYEYTAGLSYDFCQNWAGIVEYRAVRLNTDALAPNTDIDNNTLRVGGRYTF